MYAEYLCAFNFRVSNSSCVQLFAMNISSYETHKQRDYYAIRFRIQYRITFEKKKNAPDAPPSVSLSLIVMEK